MKQITEQFAKQFKRGYNYKMGGTQTLVFPNGQEFSFDDREYYSGRGSKYNGSIRHDNLGRIEITVKQVKEAYKAERERIKRMKQVEAERKAKQQRVEKARVEGVYNIIKEEYGTFVELSDEESYGRYFDPQRLARTLDISIGDASLLQSEGKTYVFARTSDGRILELYHSSLSCNYLSISVQEVSEEREKEFNHEEWSSAPYAYLLGQTSNKNHFVC